HERKGRCLCVWDHPTDPRHLQLLRAVNWRSRFTRLISPRHVVVAGVFDAVHLFRSAGLMSRRPLPCLDYWREIAITQVTALAAHTAQCSVKLEYALTWRQP